MYALFFSHKMVKILQQRSSSLSNFHSRNAYSPIFARGFSFEPCNPGSSALRDFAWFSVPVRHSKANLLSTTTLSTLSVSAKRNWPFPSSKNSHFRNEAKFKTFLVKMKFICTRIKNYFHINGFTLSLALKQRFENDRLETKIWK